MESYPFVIFITLVTVYSLFFDDIRVVAFEADSDNVFFGLTSASFCIFTFEILFGSICREGYFLSFFFWLDIVATCSMVTDVGWIWQIILGVRSSPKAGNAAQLVNVARAARVTRIIRIVRLVRLIRIVKLYKQAKIAEQAKEMRKR